MDGKTIYKWLRVCSYFDITARVYNSWLKTDRTLIGFDCMLTSKEQFAKESMLPRIREWCKERNLPVRVIDIPHMKRQFKIEIIK